MRKAQKQMALEFVGTIQEAHEEIKNFISSKTHEQAMDVLAQCQQGAIELGNFVEETAGEGTQAVALLEKYCERVFHFYNELTEGNFQNVKANLRNLRSQMQEVENRIKSDIKVRKEVAFFPYKASMWDSLESIYLVAKEDPDCDAYCVPIPYYDKKSDGSFGQMHYEGREYPSNIEVIDYTTYNFEERQPDVIYIHNPYDEFNFVTSVHPRFYAKNLTKYTEELVYVPYFVLREIEPDDTAAVNKISHFCFLPGTIHANKVILQSEKMAQIYINEYIKSAREGGFQGEHLDRKYLEKKFLGLGSPKFDKVTNTRKEELEIPEEWLKIIERPDGSWKKIIFYNTSIQALLDNGEKMLKKMMSVFVAFKENKDEVVLLWRPHPLIQTTIQSMRPQLWIEYQRIVEQYKSDGWGIYDDSTDMDRAVLISDAYYGDGSSVVELCRKRKMPIMIESVDVTEYV